MDKTGTLVPSFKIKPIVCIVWSTKAYKTFPDQELQVMQSQTQSQTRTRDIGSLESAMRPMKSRIDAIAGSWVQARFGSIVDGFRHGKLKVEWPDGSVTEHGEACGSDDLAGFGTADNPVVVKLANYEPVRRMAMRGSMGWAESYMDGSWNTNSIVALFLLFLKNENSFPSSVNGSKLSKVANKLTHRWNRNTLNGSKRNISSHYDLGNEFYRLWLDESMSYSSGWYQSSNQPLATAQQNKMDKVVAAINPRSDDHVLEIGCGWGSMASSLAEHSGCSVDAISLSEEQLRFARDQQKENSKECGNINFEFKDYRHVDGVYDHVVSIEMFEAVGREYWAEYFGKLQKVVRQGGRAVLQVITILEDRYENYNRKPDFIQKYIFPGGMLPTKTLFEEYAESYGFEVSNTDFFGDSYAYTLRDWRMRFEASLNEVSDQGFDQRFCRMWNYYLAYCEAGFTTGSTDVGIWTLTKK